MVQKNVGNGLWESSRMMLPEHKLRINQQLVTLNRRDRVNLDDQELELIGQALQESLKTRALVRIRMYDEYEYPEVIGVVDRISQLHGRFLVNGDWFNLEDIEGAELYD